MFESIKATAVAEFDLCAAGPVLVSSGKNNELDPCLPDRVFLSGSNGTENAFVIPGSSIKGVIRGFVYDAIKYGKDIKIDEEILFGTQRNGARKSKIAFHDAYADMSTVVSNIRHSTAIDPILQNAKEGSLNNMQTVEKGVFKAGFIIKNYTDDEISIIINALKAVNKGILRFGGKTGRGFGMMRVENFNMETYKGFDENLDRMSDNKYSSLDECVWGGK